MLLTADELIEKFFGSSKKISVHKIYRLAKKHHIPSVKLDGRIFFPDDQFSEWINMQCQAKSDANILKPYGRDKQFGTLRVINE